MAAKKVSFEETLVGEIKVDDPKGQEVKEVDQQQLDESGQDQPFVIEKKKKKKSIKKSFPLYMDEDRVNELDRICNKTGYTRNELINLMISYALKNVEIK